MSVRRTPARRAPQGFTLIELLIAITLMGLMALMSWRGIDGMVRVQEQTRERGDALLALQVALSQWGADLDAVLPLPHTIPLEWDGQALRMTRRSSAGLGEGALVVAWSLRNVNGTDQWLRWQSAPVTTRIDWQSAWDQAAVWARSPGEAERRSEVVLLPLAGWQIFYYRGNAWSNPLSSSGSPTPQSVGEASTAQLGQGKVPDGVRLQLELAPGQALAGQVTRDWVNPLNGGGKS